MRLDFLYWLIVVSLLYLKSLNEMWCRISTNICSNSNDDVVTCWEGHSAVENTFYELLFVISLWHHVCERLVLNAKLKVIGGVWNVVNNCRTVARGLTWTWWLHTNGTSLAKVLLSQYLTMALRKIIRTSGRTMCVQTYFSVLSSAYTLKLLRVLVVLPLISLVFRDD